jgi:hypothetical protein
MQLQLLARVKKKLQDIVYLNVFEKAPVESVGNKVLFLYPSQYRDASSAGLWYLIIMFCFDSLIDITACLDKS